MRRTKNNFFLPNDVCCYCNRPLFFNGLMATREHIVPKSQGGNDSVKNLKPCCFECNQLRANLDHNQFRTTVWNMIKILNGKYTIKLKDLETVYENLYRPNQ